MTDAGGGQPTNFEGRTVGNRYQVRELLGAGGMASVYLAYDGVLDRQVAVKTLHSELGREAAFRERFRREAQAVAKLTHTNIVSVFDSGEDTIDGAPVPFIVMEYVDGKPLRNELDDDIRQYGAMPPEKALQVTADVLAALDVSHEMGLVHRDIKPGNVMLTKRGVVKVMDFGIARAMQSGVTSMTQTGMVVGTPQYLSPEQALGRGVDARSDLYTTGIMLFELLTGRLPFDADSPLAIAYAHVQEEPVPPSSINQALPPAVDALVARALRKNPNERFPSAQAMRTETLRISGSGATTGVAPVIIAGGPGQNSGAGVAQSVFPPVSSTGTPPPSTQPMPQGGYAYPPQQGFGPSTPPPGQPQGYATPAYSMQPGGPVTPVPASGGGTSGGGNRNLLIVAVAAVTAVVIIVGLVLVGQLSGGDDEEPEARTSPSAVPEPTGKTPTDPEPEPEPEPTDDKPKFKDEDKSRTIDAEKCTEARDYSIDDEEGEDAPVSMPDLTFKHIDSVKDCIRLAGWTLETDITYEDEAIYGKNTVLEQKPEAWRPFDPEEDKVELTVSTGKEG
ncbi:MULTISPECIES: protein kinase domain-containing protein [unclassified Streptomyces]|uniref:protein kinase domain-containing protein n=1 Tax=unclassified Streptomyces TaxID=2593676 RepID=UPI0022B6D9E1|nr:MULTISPECIES: protein kinase [unclassified Streptomyces]MCZ7413171.1 protein kinase [Streptomyces sp. WMMC897]MCZ7417795.1 protein kinase [Streptomyces sp. WMMC897]MCZ7432409.1 protein kinase [Streptomyces sp. WMMC1477]